MARVARAEVFFPGTGRAWPQPNLALLTSSDQVESNKWGQGKAGGMAAGPAPTRRWPRTQWVASWSACMAQASWTLMSSLEEHSLLLVVPFVCHSFSFPIAMVL